jgi:hypothetical protein
MMKRLMFLAAGVIASLAITTASHASTITTGVIITPNGTGGTAGDVEITYTGGTLSGVAFDVSGTLAGVATITLNGAGDEVTVVFAPATTGGTLVFDFTVASGTPDATKFALTDTVGSTLLHPIGLSVGSIVTNVVPEPSSMALLGIGLTSFVAFRRFFKRSAVV